MPPKSKKGGLKDEKIQLTVNLVKQYWPQYEINTNSIKHPTREFVLKIYKDCVQNLDQKLAFATRTNLLPYPPELDEEELLYLRLSKIRSLEEADFKLGDLYSFDPIRVNSHIFVIIHFLMFTDTIMDETVQICSTVFDVKEKMQSNEKELKELQQDKLNKQIQVTEGKARRKKLTEEAALVAPEYESTVALTEAIERKCKDKIEKIDKLKIELENIQEEIQKLEKTQSYLKSQVVTEEEYSSLKTSLNSLKSEDKNLEETDLSNGLLEQKQNMEHLQMCIRELTHLELPQEIFDLPNYRGQLKDKTERLQYLLNLQNNSKSEVDALKKKLENEKRTVEIEKRELQELLKTITEEGMLKENDLKKKYQQMNKDNQIKIMDLQRTLEKREADCIRLQTHLKETYDEICSKQDLALERFKLFISRVYKIPEEKE